MDHRPAGGGLRGGDVCSAADSAMTTADFYRGAAICFLVTAVVAENVGYSHTRNISGLFAIYFLLTAIYVKLPDK